MPDRRQIHHAPPGMTRAVAQYHAAGRQLIDRADCGSGGWRNAIGRHHHAGGKLDAAGVDSGQRHTGPCVAPDHVRIVAPGVAVTKLFGAFGIADRAPGPGKNQRTEFHSCSAALPHRNRRFCHRSGNPVPRAVPDCQAATADKAASRRDSALTVSVNVPAPGSVEYPKEGSIGVWVVDGNPDRAPNAVRSRADRWG